MFLFCETLQLTTHQVQERWWNQRSSKLGAGNARIIWENFLAKLGTNSSTVAFFWLAGCYLSYLCLIAKLNLLGASPTRLTQGLQLQLHMTPASGTTTTRSFFQKLALTRAPRSRTSARCAIYLRQYSFHFQIILNTWLAARSIWTLLSSKLD